MKYIRWVLAASLAIVALTGCRLFLGESTLRIFNSSSYTINDVFISSVNDSSWGADWLSSTIAPGNSCDFTGIIAGDYDIKAEEIGGGYWQFWSINLPKDDVITLTCFN
jgi:hypothetical protein